AALRTNRDEVRQVAVAEVAQIAGELFEGGVLRIEKSLRIVVACKDPGIARQRCGIDAAADEQVRLGSGAKLAQAVLTKLIAAIELGEWAGFEKRLQLGAERFVVAAREDQFDTVPERVTGQGNLQGPPCLLIGALERLSQGLAVIKKALGEKANNTLHGTRA